MLTLKIAARNILKHRRRSLVTVLTVVTGMCGIVLFGGFFEANYTGLRESVIRSQYGHVQIFKQGYEDNYRTDPAASRIDSALAAGVIALLEEDPDVELFSRRIETSGLLGNATTSQAVMLRGMDPEQESMINSSLTILTGGDVTSDEPEGVLLGEGLASPERQGRGRCRDSQPTLNEPRHGFLPSVTPCSNRRRARPGNSSGYSATIG